LGVPMLLVYVIGFPAFALFSMWRLRQRAAMQQRRVKTMKGHGTWGLFYSAFRDETWWWEGTTAARKICVAMIGVFGANMGRMQVPVTLLLVSLVVLLTAMVRPYGDANWGPTFQQLEILSLIGLFMTLWAALAFAAYPRCKGAEADDAAAELPWCVLLSVFVGCLDVGIVVVVIIVFLRLKGAAKCMDMCLGSMQTRMRGMSGSVSMRIRRVATFLETEQSRQRRIRAETVESAAQGNEIYCNPLEEANGDIEMTSL
jgi:hypothetical protein